MTEPLFLEDIVDIARKVQQDHEAPWVHTTTVSERFAHELAERGHDIHPDMWGAAALLMRTAIGPEEHDALYAFPYPALVGAAFALAGRSGDWSNLALDFEDRIEDDYPDGASIPGCDGRCKADAAGSCACSGRCHHYPKIRAAYTRLGEAAQATEMLLDAAVLVWRQERTSP